jgi:hypothetical protein
MNQPQNLLFMPAKGLSSPHLQMLMATYLPTGAAPPSDHCRIALADGDELSCWLSTPENWTSNSSTIVLVHGLGGSFQSPYMVRIARKFFERGERVLRVNLRNCGSGVGLSARPYCGGNSSDLAAVVEWLYSTAPASPIQPIGFSLGGNIVLKLAGENPATAQYCRRIIAICPPLDLELCVYAIEGYPFYHWYYLRSILKQAKRWVEKPIASVYQFDDLITAPCWGFQNAQDYYSHCSSRHYLSSIDVETHLLFAHDDPFVTLDPLQGLSCGGNIHIWTTEQGSHMGFIGRGNSLSERFWLDQWLLDCTMPR